MSTIIAEPKNLRRRVGRIQVSRACLERVLAGDEHAAAGWAAIFKDFIVMHTDSNWIGESCTYIGYHPEFEIKEEGADWPFYTVAVRREQLEHGIVNYVAEFKRTQP